MYTFQPSAAFARILECFNCVSNSSFPLVHYLSGVVITSNQDHYAIPKLKYSYLNKSVCIFQMCCKGDCTLLPLLFPLWCHVWGTYEYTERPFLPATAYMKYARHSPKFAYFAKVCIMILCRHQECNVVQHIHKRDLNTIGLTHYIAISQKLR